MTLRGRATWFYPRACHTRPRSAARRLRRRWTIRRLRRRWTIRRLGPDAPTPESLVLPMRPMRQHPREPLGDVPQKPCIISPGSMVLPVRQHPRGPLGQLPGSMVLRQHPSWASGPTPTPSTARVAPETNQHRTTLSRAARAARLAQVPKLAFPRRCRTNSSPDRPPDRPRLRSDSQWTCSTISRPSGHAQLAARVAPLPW